MLVILTVLHRGRVRVRVRVGAWMSQYREQSQVGRFTPRPHFIVLTIAQRAHYKAESETACRVNMLKLVGLGWVEAWDISEQRIPRSFHLRPFIVLTITKRTHYKAEGQG